MASFDGLGVSVSLAMITDSVGMSDGEIFLHC